MALRLVYQISCTVIKPTFLENSSECLRRFRSLSPVLKPTEERGFSSSRSDASHHSRRRSHSYPRKSLMRSDNPCSQNDNRLLSTEGGNEDEPYEEYHRDETEYVRPNQVQTRNNMQAKSSPGLQIKRQQSAFKFQPKQVQPVKRSRSNSAIRLNAKAEAQLHQYHLKDSVPEEKINVFNVFEYYSEQYKRKASTVMPHLQPHNLKPYGTGENLTFPTHYKSRSIKYPVTESDYGEQVGSKPQKKGKSGDKEKKNYSTSCTASTSDEQLQKCKQLLAEYKKINPGYVPPNKKVSIAPGSTEEASFLQKTMKLISEFNVQQIRRRPIPGSSEDLHKCNQVISDYKKINPDYKPVKKEVKSGSQEEKEAVNTALNFAANYKKFCHNSNKQENQGPVFPLKNNTVSECLIKDHSNWSVKSSEKQLQPEEDEEALPNILVSSVSLPNMLTNLPEMSVKPVKLKVGPKANLLQSNAPPEDALLWDNVRLEQNEKLISPWPSYADHLKRQIGPTKKTRQIIYPLKSDSSKILKNTKNIEIQAAKVQPKLELSTRSLHKNVKWSPVTKASAKNEESWKKNQAHGAPKKGTGIKTHRSLPNLRYFVRGCSTTAKGTFCDEKPVPPKRSKSKNVCDTIEFESPPTTTDFFNSHDCKCVEQRLPLDVPPLARPKKRSNPKELPKICPVVKPCTTPRADAGLETKRKRLPKIIPAENCPCIQQKMREGCPLPRLKKACVREPPKICPPCTDIRCTCPPRADEGLEIKKKCLPKLAPSNDCRCIDPIFTDVPPLKPLKKVVVPEPQRICLVPRFCDIPRADSKLKAKVKPLPKITASDCPCLEPEPLKTVPLARLKKVIVEDPPRTCIKKPPEIAYRADGKMKIPQRSLPPLEPVECRCIEPKIPIDVKPLTRLKKRSNPVEPPKSCPVIKPCTIPRADEKLTIEKRKLPEICPADDCPCIEQKMKEGCPLPRLKRGCVKEPPKICPPCLDITCNCPPRADRCLKIEKKCLPVLKPGGCPCYEPKIPVDVPRLKQLKKVKIEEPGNTCPPPPNLCPPRADDKMVTKLKKLPKLVARGCECVEPPPLKSVPLPRLKRNDVCEPSNACPDPIDPCDPSETDRADEICKYKIKVKKLPPMLLKAEHNHVSLRNFTNKGPRLRTSHKRKFSIYSKMNGSWKARRILSAINFSLSPVNNYCKKMVQYWVEEEDSDMTPKLKRLSRFKEDDVDRSKLPHRPRECTHGSPRADDNWKLKKKNLPRLEPSKCPEVDIRESYSKENQPQLKRLPRLETKDIDWSKKRPCSKPECKSANPRADDNRKSRTKSLPKIMDEASDADLAKLDNSDTKWVTIRDNIAKSAVLTPGKQNHHQGNPPCACNKWEKRPLKEVVLRRLPKFKKNDIDWKAVLSCHKTCPSTGVVPRADRNRKTEQKYLPKLRDGDCPSTDRTPEMVDVEPLKRLHKFKKDDINWDAIASCHKTCPSTGVVPRADWNLKTKKKYLPKLMDSDDCPPTDRTPEMVDVEPLKRLHKFKQDDIDWDAIPSCHKTCPSTGVVPRADWNLKTKKKYLPKLMDSDDCPPIDRTPEMVDVEPLKRLHKFKKDDINWDDIASCHKTCPSTGAVPRADWNLKTKKKYLPKLMDSDDCPPIDRTPEMVDVEPLKRLHKFKTDDINWDAIASCHKTCPSTGVVHRADWNLKTKKKYLPKLMDSDDCPPIDRTPEMVDVEPLKRLHKFKKDDINWDDIASCHKTCPSTGVVPRADWNLKTKKKSLPKLMDSDDCPPIDSTPEMVDVEPLKRLHKFKKNDIDWTAIPSCHKTCPSTGVVPRADWNLKTEKKYLPKLMDSDCPPIDSTPEMVDVEPLKRLHKFKEDDTNWDAIPSCHKTCPSTGVVPRADWNLKPEKKNLPKLVDSDCPRIDTTPEMVDVEPLKRLHKFKKDDIDWKGIPSCHKTCPSTGVVPRPDAKLRIKSKSLPRLTAGTCPRTETESSVDHKSAIPLQRLPKFEKKDQNWKESAKCTKPCSGASRADRNLKPRSKSLPQLKPSRCPRTNEDMVQLKRLVKVQNQEDPPHKYLNRVSSTERADELLGYDCKKKQLPPLLPIPLRKSYHTARRLPSYPIYPTYRDVAYVRYQMINTTRSLLKDPPKDTKKNSRTGCEPFGTKKKLCPTQKPLPGCKPRGQERCQKDFVFKDCSKQKSPYPSFSECGSVSEWPKCECNPNPDMKILQPHYPLIKEIKLLKAPPPDQSFVDVQKDKKCALKKLGKTEEGETKTCENFNDPPKEPKAADMLAQGACPPPKATCPKPKETCPKPKETCPKPKETCPKPKETCPKPKKACPKPKKACPKPKKTCAKSKKTKPKKKQKDTFCARRAKAKGSSKSTCSKPSGKKGKKAPAAKKCAKAPAGKKCGKAPAAKKGAKAPVKKKKSVPELCAARLKNKSKCSSTKATATTKKEFKPKTKKEPPKGPCKNAFKPGTKKDAKPASKSESKASIKVAPTSGPPAVIPQEKPKGFIATILAFFTSKPQPKSTVAVKKTPSATGKASSTPAKAPSPAPKAPSAAPKAPSAAAKAPSAAAKAPSAPKKTPSATSAKTCPSKPQVACTTEKKCPKPPKCLCKKKPNVSKCGGQSNAKACKPPTKKGASKVKKKPIPKKAKAKKAAVKCGKKENKPAKCAKKEKKPAKCPPAKKSNPCAKNTKPKKKAAQKKPKSVGPCAKEEKFVCPPTHEELEAKCGDPCAKKPKKKEKPFVCPPTHEELEGKSGNPCATRPPPRGGGVQRRPADPCAVRKRRNVPCSCPPVQDLNKFKSAQLDKIKAKQKPVTCPAPINATKFMKMFPPDMPDLTPRRRIRRKVRPRPAPKCIPMEACIRLSKNWADNLIESNQELERLCRPQEANICKPKPQEPVCPPPPPKQEACKPKKVVRKAKKAVCKPKKPKTAVCKPKKAKKAKKAKAPVCKTKVKAPVPKKPKAKACKPKKPKAAAGKPKKPKAAACKPKKPKAAAGKPKKPKAAACKPKKPKAPVCKTKAKKKAPCPRKTAPKKPSPKKAAPKSTCSEKKAPKSECPKKSDKCTKIKSDCAPRGREVCDKVWVFPKCKAQESPYPSFSECRPPFPQQRISECLVAKKRAKATLETLRKSLERKQKSQEDGKCNDKSKRSYSTMCAVARARGFHVPTQWRRHYSSNTGGRGSNNSSQSLDKTKKKSDNKNGKRNDALNQHLLASIEEGIENLEAQDLDLPNNLYYQVLKALQKLSEKEVYDFFDQEAQFNPFCLLKSEVNETVSFVCKLDARDQQTLFVNNDINFQPRCVGISDPNALSEEMKVIESFKNLCRKLCEEADYHDLPYEELERLKTEDMRRELDELLRKAQNKQ